MTNTCELVTKIFNESMHVLNVSFHIMPEILFRNIIGVNYILYIDTDSILKARDVLIYPAVMVLNIIHWQS